MGEGDCVVDIEGFDREEADMETDMMIKPDDLKTLNMYSIEPTDGITFGCG